MKILILLLYLYIVSLALLINSSWGQFLTEPIQAAEESLGAEEQVAMRKLGRKAPHYEEAPDHGVFKDSALNRDILILTLVVLVIFLLDPLKIFIGTCRPINAVSIPNNVIRLRKGKSQDYLILNLISFGDASVQTAMANTNPKITHIQTVEEVINGVKFIFILRETIVVGYNVTLDLQECTSENE